MSAAGSDRLLPGLVGRSRAWQRVREQAIRYARSQAPLLVTGEPGVGKLALVQAMHTGAGAAGGVRVVDAALQLLDGPVAWLAEVRSAAADPGTGVLVVAHLEALQEPVAGALASLIDLQRRRRPQLRWVATITAGAAVGGLGRVVDRLGHTRLHLAPLRERPDDIPLLVETLSARHSKGEHRQYWSPAALGVLARLAWPGNVRQLEALVCSLLAERRGAPIEVGDLPVELLRQATLAAVPAAGNSLELAAVRRAVIVAALAAAGGNKSEAARRLGIGRSTLYRQLAALGISPSDWNDPGPPTRPEGQSRSG
jgi:sigma-54 dependent transcriptional regulator, acetoin dehydrogenase operon transcriptional activator AcoR